MGITLAKGQKVSLTKSNPGLKKSNSRTRMGY